MAKKQTEQPTLELENSKLLADILVRYCTNDLCQLNSAGLEELITNAINVLAGEMFLIVAQVRANDMDELKKKVEALSTENSRLKDNLKSAFRRIRALESEQIACE